MALGLAFAVLMNSVLPGRRVVRTMIYLPLVISGVAVGLIGTFLYNETVGVFDQILGALGLPGIPWQSNGPAAFASVVLITLWIRVGFNMIIYLAGLQAVPTELYEAAQTEGAGGWPRFRFITLPLLGPVQLLPADHERHLLLPGLRHHLRADQRRAGLGHRGAGDVRVQDRVRRRPGTRATAPRSAWSSSCSRWPSPSCSGGAAAPGTRWPDGRHGSGHGAGRRLRRRRLRRPRRGGVGGAGSAWRCGSSWR